MTETYAPEPDVDLLVVKIRDDVLGGVANLKVSDRFPLDGADLPSGGVGTLVVARAVPGGDDIGNGLYRVNYEVNVWAPTRREAFLVSDRIRSWLTRRGGRRLDAAGVMSKAEAVARPTRFPDTGGANGRPVRYVASYVLTLRAAPMI